jgi:3',5'-cyclic-AMP phosphodiesterase
MSLRIAHLTDPHMNGSHDRRSRFARALDQARERGAEHLLLTGDLTSVGSPSQFAELSGVLERWPHRATIVPGNHDGPHGLSAILRGALSRYARDSTPGVPVALGEAVVVPVTTYYPRRSWAFQALGSLGRAQLAAIDRVAHATRLPVLVAMHHGPQKDPLRMFAGLVDRHRMNALLARHGHVSVACGHDHRVMDVGRVRVAASCATHPDPLRIYEVGEGTLDASARSACQGSYLGESVCGV